MNNEMSEKKYSIFFFKRAIYLSIFFLVLHTAGLRIYTSIISGTSPNGVHLDFYTMAIGITYFLSWSSFIIIVPIFLLTAFFMKILEFKTKIIRNGEINE